MGLIDGVILAIADKLLIGLLILIAGFWLNRRLERLKAGLAFQTALAPQRTRAFGALWAKTQPLSEREIFMLEFSKFQELFDRLRGWYYGQGNAMYLSLDAADLFLRGLNLLEDGIKSSEIAKAERENIRKTFSGLRTQLKVDLGIYAKAEAPKRIPSNRKLMGVPGAARRRPEFGESPEQSKPARD